MSQWVPHVVPFGSCQQQEWWINGFLVHAMHYVTFNGFQYQVALSPRYTRVFQLIYQQMRCPTSYLRGCITVSQKRWVTGRMKQGALQEECRNPTLELIVFTGFEKGGMSKSLFEAIGRMQVVRGIKKNYFFINLSARGPAH